MGLCTGTCCNVEARAAEKAAKVAAFEAVWAERQARKAAEAGALVLRDRETAQEWANVHDLTFAEAQERRRRTEALDAETRLNRMVEAERVAARAARPGAVDWGAGSAEDFASWRRANMPGGD